MDDDSFDPRSWGKKPAQGDSNSPPAESSPPTSPAEATPPSQAESALPEAWRGISRGAAADPAVAGQAAPPSVKPPRAAPGQPRWPYALSALILLGAALAAWLTRVPPVTEAPPPTAAVAAASPQAPGEVKRSVVLAGAGDLLSALVAAGVPNDEAQAAAGAAAKTITQAGEVHASLVLRPDGSSFHLVRLDASLADGSGAVFIRNADGTVTGTRVEAELTKQIVVKRGELDSESFYTSAVTAGVLDTLIPEFINAFSFDFNLASEVHPGDTFEVAYEQTVNANGGTVGQPQLLFAQLTTKEKSVALYRYVSPDGSVGWYDGNGASTKRGLMRTPVDGARITSNFGMRFHPVLHYTRLHAGVDFGVPVGTPVYAAAAGVVIGATPTGCGGNMAVVQHDNGWVTRYFHLSKYADGLHEGQRVEQGFTLGLSGTTGTCTTGPHLHFELRINGEPVDPLSVKMDDKEKKKLEGDLLQAFMRQRNRVDVARAQQQI